jgi:tetratricopeptide (TPR) repeat protein
MTAGPLSPQVEIARWHEELRRTHSGVDVIHAIEQRIQGEPDPKKLWVLKFALAKEHEAQGNQGAADAIYNNDPATQAHNWIRDLREIHADMDIIPAIEQRIQSETDAQKLRALSFELASSHKMVGNYAAAEAIYRRIFDDDPDEPMPLTILAEQKLYREERPEAAMPIIDRAIEAAFRSGNFRRHALAVKARIALQLKSYQVVEDVLRQIMQVKFERGNCDIAVERDFFDRLPPGAISDDVARQYDQFSGRRKQG